MYILVDVCVRLSEKCKSVCVCIVLARWCPAAVVVLYIHVYVHTVILDNMPVM